MSEHEKKERMRKMLAYWVVISLFHTAEYATDPLFGWIPFYFWCKFGFLLWMQYGDFSVSCPHFAFKPAACTFCFLSWVGTNRITSSVFYQGADTIYRIMVGPILRRHRETIDGAAHSFLFFSDRHPTAFCLLISVCLSGQLAYVSDKASTGIADLFDWSAGCIGSLFSHVRGDRERKRESEETEER